MKRIKLGLRLMLVFILANAFSAKGMTTLTATSGSYNNEYYSYENMGTFYDTIYINTGTSKSIALQITPFLEGADAVYIYQINGSGVSELMYTINEYDNSYHEFETLYTNGKIKIILMTNFYPSDYGYNSISLTYNTTNRTNLSNGDAIIAGKVGIGVAYPQTTLHINGGIRGNEANGALGVSTTLGNVRVGQTSGYDITTDRSYFLFDKEIRTSTGQIGSTTSRDLLLRTNGTTRMTIKYTNGNVAINTAAVTQTLNVGGTLSISPSGTTAFESNKGNLMITKPAASGQYINLSRSGNASWSIGTVYNTNTFAIGQGNATDASFTTPAFNIATTGNVGIGVVNPQNKLDVNGTIHAKAVVVDLNNYADFVFEKGYQLPKLAQVEEFIKTNGHLPDVPSAKEAKENGINLVDMQVKLLQKVEELTLYALDQQKKLEEQQKMIDQLEERLKGVK